MNISAGAMNAEDSRGGREAIKGASRQGSETRVRNKRTPDWVFHKIGNLRSL